MQIVIDIPEEMVMALKQGSFGAKYNMYDLVGCVMNGTPLPKHGRLIDADELIEGKVANDWTRIQAECANTIIEADGGDAE